jgi:hypothetical protein
LSPCEKVSAVARRKAIYETLHPETKQGGVVKDHGRDDKGRVRSRQNGDNGADRFTKDTKKNTGMAERTVQVAVNRASARQPSWSGRR